MKKRGLFWRVAIPVLMAVICFTGCPNDSDKTAFTYQLAYHPNGGEGTMEADTFTNGEAANLKANSFTRAYPRYFTGWSKTADGTVEFTDGQEVTSLASKAGETVTLYAVWGDKTPTGMKWIEAGSFMMGSPQSEPKNPSGTVNHAIEAEHKVTLTKGFFIGITPVTQIEYERLMKENPSSFKGMDSDYDEGKGDLEKNEHKNFPINALSWNKAVEFCNALSQKEGLTPVYTLNYTGTTLASVDWDRNATGYRLPTEAEWEYACRAGTEGWVFNFWNEETKAYGKDTIVNLASWNGETKAYGGTDISANGDANIRSNGTQYNGSPTGEYLNTPVDVKTYPPNAWGLYDMHGNVLECTWSEYVNYPAEETDPTNPKSITGANVVFRGGHYQAYGYQSRSAFRQNYPRAIGIPHVGLRIVRSQFE